MPTATLPVQPKTIRNVVYLSPETTAYICSFPKRKRSERVESIFQEHKKREGFHDAYEALLKLREKFKGRATTKQVVEWIRKDRRSH